MQMGSMTNKMQQIRFRPVLCPGPRWGAHDAPPHSLVPPTPFQRTSTAYRPEPLIPPLYAFTLTTDCKQANTNVTMDSQCMQGCQADAACALARWQHFFA